MSDRNQRGPRTEAEAYTRDAERSGMLNLAIGESPYGISKAARAALNEAAAAPLPYPDSSCTILKEAIAEVHNVDPAMLFVGNGIDEIILSACIAFVNPGDPVLLNASTFSGFRSGIEIAGGRVVEAPLRQYNVDLEALSSRLECGAALWFLCNPHSPTGTAVDLDRCRALLEKCSKHGTIVAIDEAFAEYADPGSFRSFLPCVAKYPNLLVMRTMSKAYGLAGLRCGYAIGQVELIERLSRLKSALTFSVNRLALAAATAAIRDQAFVRRCRELNAKVKEYFCSELRLLGIPFVPSSTNFVLVNLERSAPPICHEMRSRFGILVRSAEPFGFAGHIRITLGTKEQMQGVIRGLGYLLKRRDMPPRRPRPERKDHLSEPLKSAASRKS